MLETLAEILGIWFGLSLAFAFVWALAHHREIEPPRPARVTLTRFVCDHCEREHLWPKQIGSWRCICGGTYRDAWQEPRVLREAAEIVRQAG